jgi:hypothetical protein
LDVLVFVVVLVLLVVIAIAGWQRLPIGAARRKPGDDGSTEP